MKKYLFMMLALVIVSCSDQMVLDETQGEYSSVTPVSDFQTLLGKARWGDGQAYLRLADCYRDGKGVKSDFIGMLSMVSLANDYSDSNQMDAYLEAIPANSEFRILVDCIHMFEHNQMEEALPLIESAIANGSPDGYAIKGITVLERGDSIEAKHLFELAAEKGSNLAELLLCIPDWKGAMNPSIEKLSALTDKIPWTCNILAGIYTGMEGNEIVDERMAAYYYMEADKYACLTRRGARWLWSYMERGSDLNLSPTDKERIQLLADIKPLPPLPVKHNDPILESAITDVLHGGMNDYMAWSKAMVCVVETQTGKIIADVKYEREGKMYIPCIDTYNQEQSTMVGAATYLALLSSGKVNPELVFDTNNGIYGEVRDHNWRRGGYGTISLSRALEVRSQVAFTMAKEYAYGRSFPEYDALISSYFDDNPNKAVGILTFYNAVANGGKMLKMVSEGEDGIVIKEQIAHPDHIKALQKGLENAVAQGIFKKAGNYQTKVSACGRTFITEGNHRRMELCGYFPSESPLYTIMVVLEKDGLPASAGGMCGPIFSNTVDVLVDLYGLQSVVTRSYDDSDDLIEIVDTVAVQ